MAQGRQPQRGRAQRARARLNAVRRSGEQGMTTAEYAVGTVAACGFGGVLYKLLTNESILDLLSTVVKRALGFGL